MTQSPASGFQNTFPALSIILPTKDRMPILLKTLDSLLNATKSVNCEIYIIDNSTISDIELPEHLKRPFLQVMKNPRDRNSVFSSRNYGASLARAPILLFLDDDIITNAESIEWVVRFHSEHEKAAANVSWKYPPWLLERMQSQSFGRFLIGAGFTTMRELYGADRWKEGVLFESGEVASFFFSVRRSTFEAMGGYEERHLHEGTDIPLIESLQQLNVPMYIHAGITVFHNEEDRIEPASWLERKKRMGEVSARAVRMNKRTGHEFSYSAIKSTLLSLMWVLRKPLLFVVRKNGFYILPGGMMRAIISGLTGAYIRKGYKEGMNAAI